MNLDDIKYYNDMLDLWKFNDCYLFFSKDNVQKKYFTEYLDFLYKVGDFEKLNTILDKRDASGTINETCMEFTKNKDNIKTCIEVAFDLDKALCFLDNKSGDQLPLINYIIRIHINSGKLDVSVINRFINIMLNTKDRLLEKSFFLKKIIDYYFIFDKSFFLNSRNILTMIQKNFTNSFAARIYYDKFQYGYNIAYFDSNSIKEKLPNKTKVALCISGALRGNFVKYINDYIKQLDFPVDVFLFSWNSLYIWNGLGGSYTDWASRIFPKKLNVPEIINTKQKFKKLLPNLYNKLSSCVFINVPDEKISLIDNLVSIKLESHDEFEEKYLSHRKSLFSPNVIKQYYGNYNLYKMINKFELENNFLYDYVIKIRPDMLECSRLKLDDLSNLSCMDICVSHYPGFGSLDDAFAAGKRNSMMLYLSFYDFMQKYKYLPFLKEYPFFPEGTHNILHKYFSLNGIRAISPGINFNIKLPTADCYLPDFDQELAFDINNINSVDIKENVILFFRTMKQNFFKNNREYYEIFSYNIFYRLGVISLKNSSPKNCFLLPFILYREYKKYKKNKTKDISVYYKSILVDTLEYKIGVHLSKAYKYWYIGGYFYFYLILVLKYRKQIKEAHDNSYQ